VLLHQYVTLAFCTWSVANIA